ncbi:MAG: pitrilysin family protein, partial [Planctomycetota bacterium]
VTYETATLDNGLTVVGEIDPDAVSAACGFFVRTGARDEAPEVMGVSHFLEHMMFKGTDARTAEQVNSDFDNLGADHNAFTSSELTCFYASVLPERLPQAFEVLADIMRPALRTEDFDTEKGVILEEIAMYKDSPFWVLYERAMEEYYADHPLGHRVLGTDDTIMQLARDQMDAYFRERYSADNTVLAVAGDADFGAVVDLAQRHCGGWNTTDASRDTAAPTPHGGELHLTSDKFDRAYCLMLAPGPAMDDDRRFAATMLARVLGDPGNSRLHWALIETGIAEEAAAAFGERDGCGDFFVYASGDPDRFDRIREIMDREIDALIGSVEEDDLERLRNTAATRATLEGERPKGRMIRLGTLHTYPGSYMPLEDELAKITAVTLDDLRAVWEAFPLEPRLVSTLTPAG